MRASDFDFELPPGHIAQAPLGRRDEARLYVLDRQSGAVRHQQVRDLPSLLPPGALVVVNDTRVIKARLSAHKPTGGAVELLLVEPLAEARVWRCLGGASKPIRPGPLTLAGAGAPAAEVLAVDGKYVEVRFGGDPLAYAEAHGQVPLPPYIKRPAGDEADSDADRYQTVFARAPGAVAAPTAGLHFTPELLSSLTARGVGRASVTLHVGPGTFAPLGDGDLDAETLHAERYEIPDATGRAIAETRAAQKPIVAVGTTVVRTLEAAATPEGGVRTGQGTTSIFLRPGHRFAAVDIMLTNFHLPRSSLVILVAAFAGADGRARILEAYRDAVARGYRFYSYGDAMLIT
jgi:S-adenosylmethionine:tRNA ribosyltransferase-isomerase